jgi:hypothetical protein
MSPCVTDSRGLYDAGRSQSAGLGVSEKRTAIEVAMVNDRMAVLNGIWRCTSAHQQLADGLTKVSARQKLADIMKRGMHALKYDETFTALKKLTQKQKDARERELDLAADNALAAETTTTTSTTPSTSLTTSPSTAPSTSLTSPSTAPLASLSTPTPVKPSTGGAVRSGPGSLTSTTTSLGRPSKSRLWGHEKVLAAVIAAQSTAGADAAGMVRYTSAGASNDDGTVLLMIAVVLFGILSLIVGACVGALLLYKFGKPMLEVAPAASEAAPAAPPAAPAAPAAAKAATVYCANCAVQVLQKTIAVQTETTIEEYYDDVDCPDAVRWVTKSGIKYHRYKCTGTNGFDLRKVTPCLVCARMWKQS